MGNFFWRSKDCKQRVNKEEKSFLAVIDNKKTLNPEGLSQAETKALT
jgi:hypothetical protein